jgi:AcrR family transcriptional regulator
MKDKLLKLKPLQKRSQDTVKAILEASTRILESQDWGKFNTNYIADKAGVSVGSLYQYFKNKDSILYEIIEKQLLENWKFMEERVRQNQSSSFEDILDDIISVVFTRMKEKTFATRFLSQHIPGLLDANHFQKVDQEMINFFLEQIKTRGLRINRPNPELALSIVNQTFRINIFYYLSKNKGRFNDDEFKQELKTIILNYLQLKKEEPV